MIFIQNKNGNQGQNRKKNHYNKNNAPLFQSHKTHTQYLGEKHKKNSCGFKGQGKPIYFDKIGNLSKRKPSTQRKSLENTSQILIKVNRKTS